MAILEGEKDRRSFATAAIFGGLCTASLVGDNDTTAGVPFILTWNLEAEGGDLMRNLCGVVVCLPLAITGEPVLQNFCWREEADEKMGLGNSTVFFAHGRFLGETRWAATTCR